MKCSWLFSGSVSYVPDGIWILINVFKELWLYTSVPTQLNQPTTAHFIRHPFYYSRITSAKSCHFAGQPSAWVSNLYGPPVSDYYYVNRRILASPPLWFRNTMVYVPHDLAHFPISTTNVTYAWRWRLCGINRALPAELAHFTQFICLFR